MKPVYYVMFFGLVLAISTATSFVGYHYLALANEYREANFEHLDAVYSAIDRIRQQPVPTKDDLGELTSLVKHANAQAIWCTENLTAVETMMFQLLGAAEAFDICRKAVDTGESSLQFLAALSESYTGANRSVTASFVLYSQIIREIERLRDLSISFQPFVTQIQAQLEVLVRTGTAMLCLLLIGLSVLVARQLILAQERAQAASRGKSQFLATMSHEIRTPMNGIIGMSELLQETKLDDDQKQCADTIYDSAQALLSLINDILDISKIEAGKVNLNTETVCISQLLDDVAQLLSNAAFERGLELLVDDQINIDDDNLRRGTKKFLTDPARLRQVLVNIVGNAVKFTLEGRVLIAARMLSGSTDHAASVEISVSDTGIGIPKEKLEHIFSPFEQADSTISRRFEGSGLGLAISRSLVLAMGGQISVASVEGEGTTFKILLPLEYRLDSSSFEDARPLSGKSVALISGNPESSRVVGSMLIAEGISLHVVDAPPSGQTIQLPEDIEIVVFDTDNSGKLAKEAVLTILEELRQSVPALVLSSAEKMIEPSNRAVSVKRKPIRRRSLRDSLLALLGTREVSVYAKDTKNDGLYLSERVILIAEDNRTNRLVMKKMLKPTSAKLVFVENGEQAVEAFREDQFDLVLMDVSMPMMNGHEATRAIREIEGARSTKVRCPIIAVTAHAMQEDRDRCAAAGMDIVLTKPVRKVELFKVLSQALDLEDIPEDKAQFM